MLHINFSSLCSYIRVRHWFVHGVMAFPARPIPVTRPLLPIDPVLLELAVGGLKRTPSF